MQFNSRKIKTEYGCLLGIFNFCTADQEEEVASGLWAWDLEEEVASGLWA